MVTQMVALPEDPAVQVIELVYGRAEVIVPPVMVQAYVAPAPALATVATLPFDHAHTELGAVIVQSVGQVCLIVTDLLH